jgi:type I restriction-modification system DNA methylase subunit
MEVTKDVNTFIDLLKNKIIEANRQEITIQNNKLIYSLKQQRQYDISSYNQTTLGELGRAYAVLEIIKTLDVKPSEIMREKSTPVGSTRLDIAFDIRDVYNGRECIALVECKTSVHKISDSKFANYFKRQLYNIAHSYVKDQNESYPYVLIACEITYNKGQVNFNYYWFLYPEIENMVKTGQVSPSQLISRNSPFANTTPSKDGYFSTAVKILKSEDLIEIKHSNEFKKLLKEKLHQELRNYGIVENDAFDVIINVLLAKVYDEILSAGKPNYELEFQVKPEDFIKINDFYNRINKLFKNASIELLGEDPKVANLKEIVNHSEKGKILLQIVLYLQRIRLRSLRFLGEDSMGDIFLDFMHSIYRQSRGLFFTHPNIARFVCKALDIEGISSDLKRGDIKYILDPSCGSGTFLIEALRLIFRNCPVERIKEDARKVLFGTDNNDTATKLCKVNMAIHGDGSAHIYTRDALASLEKLPFPNITEKSIQHFNKGCTFQSLKQETGFDFIISNPPFSVEIKKSEYKDVYRMHEFVPYRGDTTTASECYFAERWFQLLNPDGKIGVVFPISLFDSPDYLKALLLFLCYFQIIAIVGLPEHAFSPHAQQRTVLVFAKRRNLDESNRLFNHMLKYINEKDLAQLIKQLIEPIKDEKIIFYDAKNIGYIRQKKQKTVITNQISEDDLSEDIADIIVKAFRGNLSIDNDKVAIKTLQELSEKGKLILSPNLSKKFLYLQEKFTIGQEWEIAEVQKLKNINTDEELFLCETGDIVAGGLGIITPKKLLSFTTSSNTQRLLKKIKGGKFGYLQEGDIVIAPVRVYQKKIAVVTKNATRFLFSSDFIVLRRKHGTNLLDSFALFYSVIQDENIRILESLSATGKSGYPKIKNKEDVLNVELYKVNISEEKLRRRIGLDNEIYKEVMQL